MTKSSRTSLPLICRLTIERFRGIERLVWCPASGVNVILGGGDVGKTTVLDAIALLLNPTNSTVISDADYLHREVDNGFCIEAVMSVPELCGINQQTKPAWPWEWDGKEPRLPNIAEQAGPSRDTRPVYRLRVRGTADFDLVYEILQPDDSTDHLSVAVRRRIGLVRLGGGDRNDRDLRLVQGSALDRLLSDKTLRARLGQKLSETDIEDGLKDDARSNLRSLDEAFQKRTLPSGLSLGIAGGHGLSLNAMIGLKATKSKVKLPLASWGAGTRRLAALEIAAAYQKERPITIVDELERGLEPYRQRVLMSELEARGSQVFLTTHSAAALSAASTAIFWYMGSPDSIGRLPSGVARHHKRDPETFLARVAIVAEGLTEVGFVTSLLEKAIGGDILPHGLWVTDGGGNDQTLKLLEDLSKSGLTFGGFADNEGRNPKRWAVLQKDLGNILFQWSVGCLEENIIKLVPDERLEDFIKDSEGESGVRRRTLAERLGIEEKDFSSIVNETSDLKMLIIQAATGSIPDNMSDTPSDGKKALRKHSERWFKSVDGGRELAAKVFRFGLWPQLKEQLLPFLNAVRKAVSLPEISTLPS